MPSPSPRCGPTNTADSSSAPAYHPPTDAKASPPPIRSRPSAPPSVTSPLKAKPPTARWSPPGNPAETPAPVPHLETSRRRARTPATGRDSDSPQAKQRGKTSSPNILLFARRSTTPTAARRYRGPRRGQGRSSNRALHLDRGCGPPVSGTCSGQRNQPHKQAASDRTVDNFIRGVPLGDMPRRRELVEHPGVDRCPVGGDLDRGEPEPQRAGEE